MYISHLIDLLEDFKALIAEEIDEIIQKDKNNDKFHMDMSARRGHQETVVQKNVPNVRNREKGLLKVKGHEQNQENNNDDYD